MSTPRKTRSDKKVGTIENLLNPSATASGKTKKVQEFKRRLPEGEVTEDQKLAAAITIKVHPKSKISELDKIRRAIRSLGPL